MQSPYPACAESNNLAGCNGFLASQADWFKISEDITYEGLWVTEKIFKDGQWPIKMPADLKPGCVNAMRDVDVS